MTDYWQCPKCGGVLEKGFGSLFKKVIGTATCGGCGTQFAQNEIYSGKYDVEVVDSTPPGKIIRVGWGFHTQKLTKEQKKALKKQYKEQQRQIEKEKDLKRIYDTPKQELETEEKKKDTGVSLRRIRLTEEQKETLKRKMEGRK